MPDPRDYETHVRKYPFEFWIKIPVTFTVKQLGEIEAIVEKHLESVEVEVSLFIETNLK